MSILVFASSPFVEAQLHALRRLAPDERIDNDPDAARADEVEAVLAFRVPPGALARYRKLRFVAAAGAGVDELLVDDAIPAGVPVTRSVDPMQAARMAQYVSLAVLRWHRELARFEAQQRERTWQRHPIDAESAWTVGLLGFGVLGQAVARALSVFGYPLRCWTRTPAHAPGVERFAGRDALPAFLAGTRVLVCLLPLTNETRGLVGPRVLAALPMDAYIVNASRGAIVDEEAVASAIASGRLAGASLDVFAREPLPRESPLWTDTRILVTPHVAATPDPVRAARQLLDNLARARRGEPLLHLVDRSRGY